MNDLNKKRNNVHYRDAPSQEKKIHKNVYTVN